MNQEAITIILLSVVFSSLLGVFLIGLWIIKNRSAARTEKRLSRFVTPTLEGQQTAPPKDSKLLSDQDVSKFRDWINKRLSVFSSEKLQLKLSSAYWTITDTEYILLRFSAGVLAFILGWLIFSNVLAGIFLAPVVIMVPAILLDRAIDKRQQKFHTQLLDTLILIKGAVQAGYSLMQALDLAVNEIPPPASEEFGRVLREIQFGISLEGAFFNLADRMDNDDVQIVVTAIIINAQVGGNLSTVLEATISTIRDRIHLFGEIKSLTSYSRYVGNFLSLMPFMTGLAVFLMNPDYFSTVQTSLLVQIIFGIALLGVIVGNFWIRQLVKIKV